MKIDSEIQENLNSLKHKIKINDIKNIDNWDNYKKKNKEIIKKKLKIDFIIVLKPKIILMLISNLNAYNNIYKKIILNNKLTNYNEIIKNYNNFNLKKIDTIKKNFLKNFENNIIIVLDFRSLKFKLFIIKKNNCAYSSTSGIIFKKMNLNNKKYKKSDKLVYLCIKNALIKNQHILNKKKIIIYTKGLRKNINNFVNYLSLKINTNKLVFINDLKVSNNKTFKFKKIKSIKRKLKKKIVKNK